MRSFSLIVFTVALLIVAPDEANCQTNPSAELAPNNTGGVSGDAFGDSIAIDGSYAIIGYGSTSSSGQVFLFAYTTKNGWQLTQTIIGPPGDWNFGQHIAASGKYVAIGNLFDKTNKSNESGSVYMYQLINGRLIFDTKLMAPRTSQFDDFGNAIALAGNETRGEFLAVGAPTMPVTGSCGGSTGQVFIYQHSPTAGWIKVWQYADNCYQTRYFGSFGSNIAMVGPTIPGLNTVGIEIAAADLNAGNKGQGEVFISDLIPTTSGFVFSGLYPIQPPDGVTYGHFGVSIARSNDGLLIVGGGCGWTCLSPSPGPNYPGRAYIYGLTTTGSNALGLEQELFSPDGSTGFGQAVSVADSDNLVIGEPNPIPIKNKSHVGYAHVYSPVVGKRSWTLANTFEFCGSSSAGYEFGGSVASLGTEALIGEPDSDPAQIFNGNVYVVNIAEPEHCPPSGINRSL